MTNPLERLRHHVSGAIERGEAQAIEGAAERPDVFKVIDTRTNQIMGVYVNRKRAVAKANKLDLEYGAVRYAVRSVAMTTRSNQGE